MSEKKSPPHKDKTQVAKPFLTDGKTNKRKLLTPASPTDDDDKRNQQKRKRLAHHTGNMMAEGSPEHTSLGSPRGAGGTAVSRLSVPKSERQQMAILMRMQDESSLGDVSPKSPSSGSQVSSSKRTPAEKKVNKRNERGEAPLHMAAKKGDYKQTKRLLKAGASVNMKDYAGWTALHEACNSGNLRVARYLLKAGADVNVQGFDDDTPLHDASSNGHKKLVQLLLRHGADPYQPNLKGKTAVKVAATAEIEAILCNSHSLGRESDPEDSAESSSDSNLSCKEDERTGIDDGMDMKAQNVTGKVDTFNSSASSTFISSSSGPTRRPSVPPSPDKMSASPRLFLKLQHKKSSSSSATDEQQRVLEWNVLSVDGAIEATPPSSSLQADSDGMDITQPSPASFCGNNKREEANTWARVRGQSPLCAAGESNQSNNCPDSTVSAGVCLTRTKTEPFTPRNSEFPSLTISNSGGNEQDIAGDVFSSATGGHYLPSPSSSNNGKQHAHPPIPSTSSLLVTTQNSPFCSTLPVSLVACEASSNKQIPPVLTLPSSSSSLSSTSTSFPPLAQTSLLQSTLNSQQLSSSARSPQHYHLQQQKHSIPSSSQPSSSYHGVKGPVNTLPSSTVTSTQQSAVSSSFTPLSVSCISASSSISSSVLSSSSVMPFLTSSHRVPSTVPPLSSSSCQFSLVSSSVPSSLPIVGQLGGPTSTVTPSAASTASGDARVTSGVTPFSSRSSGGGSIVTGLSDRAAAATGASVWEGGSLVPSSISGLMGEDRSDTSSCDSPLRLESEERLTGSRPTTPKVPPLKIIMPPKQGTVSTGQASTSGGTLANKGNKLPQAKPALPYVLNPSSNSTTQAEAGESEEQGQTMELGENTADETGPGYFSIGLGSRPSSRTGVSSSSKNTNVGLEEVGATNLDLDDGASRDEGSDTRADNTDSSGGKGEEGKRPTRTLRSHTAMLQQAQAKQDPKDKLPDKEKNGAGSVTFEEGDNSSTTKSQKGDDSVADDSNVPHRKRKLRTKTEQQTIQTAATSANTKLNQVLEKPPNPYESYLNLRRQIASRHRTLSNVAPKAPSGFKDFLMCTCTYVLQGKSTSTLSVPMLPPPSFVPAPMKEFFNQQEKERYRLRLQHTIEREKLMLSIEQEILREHGRAARAMANQRLPFSVCTILREEEIYNLQELEQVEDREKNVRSRYNGRQFISWLQAVDDKYDKIKKVLLMRHHHEAESLFAVQKMDWEWKLKECGLCDHKITPTIDDLHVPMVSVNNEFELPPSS